VIEVENLSKRYGTKLAVDGLNFVVQPGIVTGFLGPNGSGKSTTMRMIAGLDQPTAGRVTVNGGDYRSAAAPMAELGVLLEAKAVHTGRSARNHLLALAQTNGIKTGSLRSPAFPGQGISGFLTPCGSFRTIRTQPRWVSYTPRPSEAESDYSVAQCTEQCQFARAHELDTTSGSPAHSSTCR
jgi:ABC-type cobalamin/Fe3+-siderophores transport system ATPase subunit